MVDIITGVFLFYMFLSLYFLNLFLLAFTLNKGKFFDCPKPEKVRELSIIIPCFNEEKSISDTIKSVLKSDYEGLKKIIVVDDCSTDNSYRVIKNLEKKYSKVIAVQTPKNTGNAGGAKNYGIKFADTELIGFVDADSYPSKDAISKMVGFFDEEKTGVVTTNVMVRNPRNLMQRMQRIEYKIISFSRKILEFLDAIYVTPGPLAIYRGSILKEINGFDTRNMTEDIEITWRIISKGYKVKMAFDSYATTDSPDTIKKWFKQRIRWNIGGTQTILKYRKNFFRGGILGHFILPLFFFSLILGVVGISFFIYRFALKIFSYYLTTRYSYQAQVAIIVFEDINLSPSLLHFFGIFLFILGMYFVLLSLSTLNKKMGEKENPFAIIFYSLIYITLNPIVLIISIYKFLRGNYSWR